MRSKTGIWTLTALTFFVASLFVSFAAVPEAEASTCYMCRFHGPSQAFVCTLSSFGKTDCTYVHGECCEIGDQCGW